ncbi:DUF4114 domain-containing protein [Flavivirga aquimarina]|uniref:DUF4114 domain-containing protein n=1 Tax=Flavivirga aquimarina TaxID=2027862 RepID=A0ABT8W6D1_9FLAO|nr:DUF4114 domain-containing protein [Flavivirga aquimarina]MDO5968647.1 DUF4114 domain-containing protein [Flavivirga aquimarina]
MKKHLLLFSILFTSAMIAQNYNYLGAYTSNGTPLYLENPGDIVSVETQEMISNSLPESYPVPDYNPHYISSGYDTDVILDAPADVWVTFVSEGAGYRNVLGFYTYDIDNPSSTKPQPEDITIIFPNASALGSGGGLQVGDKVKIGTFEAGTGIGWVLLANAWNSSTSSVGNGHWQLFSNPDYNPEANSDLRFHNVLLNDPDNERVILGFEDIRRDYGSCDNDFNDAIFYVTANPYEAMRSTNFADVSSATDVTSANNGGLESNGDLASLIAKRNFRRKKLGKTLDKKGLQKTYSKGKTKKGEANTLENYLPDTGMYGTETAYVSSPEDLLEITNAKEVFSIDVYQDNKRVSAALATKTEGVVYDHSKVICDRLNNSSLEDIRTVTVKGHNIISSKIKRATGEIEYTLSFSIKLGEDHNQLYSFWNIAQYPEGDYNNFQIWGSSFSQVFAIANHVLDTYSNQKGLHSDLTEDKLPSVFVKSGYYTNGNVHLDIVNRSASKQMTFKGNIKETEVADINSLIKTISLSGNYTETLSIEIGALFDIGFSLSTNESEQIDAMYLADGPWGIDFLEEYVSIEDFHVDNESIDYNDDLYEVERQPTVSGQVKGNVNVFRHLLPGDLTLDVSNFNIIQFNILSNQDVEIVLMPEELTDWNNRLRYSISANQTETFHSLSFNDFVDANGNPGTLDNIKTVVFSIIGDYVNYIPFEISINDLAFAKAASLSLEEDVSKNMTLQNYPNPFKINTTIKLTNVSEFIDIKVIDMLGRTVDLQHIKTNNKKAVYNAPNLSKGVYKYLILDDLRTYHSGTFLIE